MAGDEENPTVRIDAGSFQEPLAKLAETLVQKVFREGSDHLRAPSFVSEDVSIMIRHALSTYHLLFYLNADERRKDDCYWRVTYGVAALPLIRSLIDCFFGPLPVGTYYISDFLPHAERPKMDASYDMLLSKHIGRAATVLLCMITELQAYCRFDGANINERISKLWEILMPLFEANELYQGRYSLLMKASGIVPKE